MKQLVILAGIGLSCLTGCGGNKEEKKETPAIAREEEATGKKEIPVTDNRRPPIINITDTLSVKQTLICMKDSAANQERLQRKIAEILNMKLGVVITKNKLKTTGRPTAWYATNTAPFFFEIGIPVDKKPAKAASNIYTKEIGTDSVTVAHFYGPYDMLPQAYDALKDWMKDHKKKMLGKPYEIYVDESTEKDGSLKDPYKVRTDVIFSWK